MSDTLPNVAICLLTYKRTYEALTTVESTLEHLQYPKEKLGWYVGDDGSAHDHHHAITNMLEKNGAQLIGQHNEKFRTDGFNCGKGWNLALGIAHQWTDFVLWLEDDWRMDADLDLTRYVRLLQDRQDVGIVTFRILSIGADVHTVGWDGEIFLRYDRTTQYAYSGNPLLRHARYAKHYGWFHEERNPGMIELGQDDLYRYDDGGRTMRRFDDGPQIWRPATLDMWGAWHHIGEKVWH